jgi:epoxyqueuosine reductase QueG
MDNQIFLQTLTEYINTAVGNYVEKDIAITADLEGMRIFDEPLAGFAEAPDPYFETLKKDGVIGDHFILPGEWLSGARTVISIFFPFTGTVKSANRQDPAWPAAAWLHGRIEGQAFVFAACRYMKDFLEAEGESCVVPSLDTRFSLKSPFSGDPAQQKYYTSNWSERHIAHVCGLGTFGLSRGLITAKGVAGRFGSIVTTASFTPTGRSYRGIDDYCTRCGACARKCPAGAITLEEGKRHPPCSAFLDRTQEKHRPRYGCGKCQVAVPCENGIPPRQRKT